MVDAAGTIHTVAGSGPYGSAGEGEAALSAQLGGLTAMFLAPDGSMLLGEAGTQRLLRIDPLPPAGILTRIAGRSTNPFGAYAGDGGPARLARFYSIEGIVQDAAGNVIVADFQNNRIRLVDRAAASSPSPATVTSANPGRIATRPGELACRLSAGLVQLPTVASGSTTSSSPLFPDSAARFLLAEGSLVGRRPSKAAFGELDRSWVREPSARTGDLVTAVPWGREGSGPGGFARQHVPRPPTPPPRPAAARWLPADAS